MDKKRKHYYTVEGTIVTDLGDADFLKRVHSAKSLAQVATEFESKHPDATLESVRLDPPFD